MTTRKVWQAPAGGLIASLYEGMRRWLNRRLTAYLMTEAINGNRCRILEAGSGTAFASSILARNPRIVSVALDLDPDALHEGRRRNHALSAVIGDVQRLPFPSSIFDVVWSSSTLEHLENPDGALREMGRVTVPGGYVFVGVPARHGPLGFQPWIRETAFGEWVGPVMSRRELVTRMEGVGLRPVKSLHYFFRCFVGVLARKT